MDSFFEALFDLALKRAEERRPLTPTNLTASSGLLDTARAAEFLGIAKQTMARWRVDGQGPPFIKVGGAVRYRPDDLNVWLDARRARHTAESQRRPSK